MGIATALWNCISQLVILRAVLLAKQVRISSTFNNDARPWVPVLVLKQVWALHTLHVASQLRVFVSLECILYIRCVINLLRLATLNFSDNLLTDKLMRLRLLSTVLRCIDHCVRFVNLGLCATLHLIIVSHLVLCLIASQVRWCVHLTSQIRFIDKTSGRSVLDFLISYWLSLIRSRYWWLCKLNLSWSRRVGRCGWIELGHCHVWKFLVFVPATIHCCIRTVNSGWHLRMWVFRFSLKNLHFLASSNTHWLSLLGLVDCVRLSVLAVRSYIRDVCSQSITWIVPICASDSTTHGSYRRLLLSSSFLACWYLTLFSHTLWRRPWHWLVHRRGVRLVMKVAKVWACPLSLHLLIAVISSCAWRYKVVTHGESLSLLMLCRHWVLCLCSNSWSRFVVRSHVLNLKRVRSRLHCSSTGSRCFEAQWAIV